MKRVAIIGGGIAGLSAAYYLEKARRGGAAIEWLLFEKSDRLGGVIKTEHREGCVLEAGPDSFLSVKPDGARLCRDLGIAERLIASNDAERKTYILIRGRLIPIPDGLQFMVPTRVLPMVSTPLFSWGTKLRVLGELFASAPDKDQGQDEDESVADFVRRHFGGEMVERVAEPLLAGVYGGNAGELSVRAVLPRFVEMEREHGSLVRATLSSMRRARAQAQEKNSGSSSAAQALFTSLKSGLQEMVDALVTALPAGSIRLRQSAMALRRTGSQWQIDAAGGGEFDSVVFAVPAPASATLLKPFQPKLAELLGRIQYTSSAAVALAYDRVDLPPGHGFLVPAGEGRKMLACTFVHKKFPYRAPEGCALLRCFISSARAPDLLSYSDEALADIALEELKEILHLAATPRFVQVFRWPCALPQYETGHLDRVAQMEQMLGELSGISGVSGITIVGNSLHGIGVPDCIRSGRLAAEKITSAVFEPASV